GPAAPPPAFGPDWPATWTPLCVARLGRAAPPVAPAVHRGLGSLGGFADFSGSAPSFPAAGPAGPTAPFTAEPAGEDLSDLRSTALARRTNRAPYRDTPVDPALLHRLATPGPYPYGLEALAEPVTVRHLESAAERALFADFVARHGGRDFSHRAAWRETHAYLRADPAEAAARGDGFALSQLFGPMSPVRLRATRAALAPGTMRVLSRVGYHRLLAGRLAALVRRAPVVATLSLPDAEPPPGAMVRAGCRLADYWLAATRAGLVLHPVSVVLQHEDVRLDLQRRLGLPGRLFFVSRLGHPTADFPPSPRRAVAAAWRTV
ncbi:hypothetical protein, partial [Streptomyces sp. URMC 123]|uniref:hypothetical protein n=1 Tax=Streptomyces sp. URMC 123 TaxID=3423403 RepID=UPI003F1C61A0